MKLASLFVLVAVLVLAMAGPVAATEQAVSDLVLIREGDVIDDDLLAGGTDVLIRGTIEGDLVTTAFDTVTIEGVIEGDLLALAPRVVINGDVRGSIRVLGGTVVVGAEIGDDALAAAARLEIPGHVNGSLFATSLNTLIGGAVDEGVTLQSIRASIHGTIGGDIDGTIRRGVLGGGASVGGDVSVSGSFDVVEGATVGGSVREPATRALPLQARAYAVLGLLIGLSVWLLAGPFVRWLSPAWLERRLGAAHPGQWLSAGIGALLTAIIFLGALALLASVSPSEAGVVLGIVAVLIALSITVGFAALALVGAVPLTMAVGSRVGSPKTRTSAHVRGVFVIAGVGLLPWVGSFVALLFSLSAIGAVLPQGWGASSPPGVTQGSAPAVPVPDSDEEE